MGKYTNLVEETLTEDRLTSTNSKYFKFSRELSGVLDEVRTAHEELNKLDGSLHNIIQYQGKNMSDEELDKEIEKFVKDFFSKNKNSVLKSLKPQIDKSTAKYFIRQSGTWKGK